MGTQTDDDDNDDISMQTELKSSNYYNFDEFLTFQRNHKNKFRVFSFNAQSLRTKIDDLRYILQACSNHGAAIHIVTIQETWLDDNSPDMNIYGYKLIINPPRLNKRGGLQRWQQIKSKSNQTKSFVI